MKLRDYINNTELYKEDNIKKDSYIIANEIIKLVKNNNYEQAMLELDNNLEQLYLDLDIESFCFLIDYYVNNTQEKYWIHLKNSIIPCLLLELSNDYDEKNKTYFLKKLVQFNEEKNWQRCLSCIEILLEKTSSDKLLVNKYKTSVLINLKRYEDLDLHLKKDKDNLDQTALSKGYLVLANNFAYLKNYEESYVYYLKIKEINPNYDIPSKVLRKVNSEKKSRKKIYMLFIFILLFLKAIWR